MHSCQEVVLLVIQHVIAQGHTWCHQLCDTTLNEFLGEFWIL